MMTLREEIDTVFWQEVHKSPLPLRDLSVVIVLNTAARNELHAIFVSELPKSLMQDPMELTWRGALMAWTGRTGEPRVQVFMRKK